MLVRYPETRSVTRGGQRDRGSGYTDTLGPMPSRSGVRYHRVTGTSGHEDHHPQGLLRPVNVPERDRDLPHSRSQPWDDTRPETREVHEVE